MSHRVQLALATFASFLAAAQGFPGSVAFLDCEGVAASAWAELRGQAQRYAWFGGPVGEELLQTAEGILQEWSDTAVRFIVNWERYFHGDTEGLAQDPAWFHEDWLRERGRDKPTLDFCLYGFITALFIRARFYHERCADVVSKLPAVLEAGGDAALPSAAAQELAAAATQDYEMALRLLGSELSLDFLESSSWRVTSWALTLHLWNISGGSRSDLALLCASPPDAQTPELLDPSGINGMSEEGLLAPSLLGPDFAPAGRPWPVLARPRALPAAAPPHVLVLGTHTAFARECATMVRAALDDVPGLRLSLHGVATGQTCHLANACSELDRGNGRSGTVAGFVQAWLLSWHLIEEAPSAGKFAEAVSELRAALLASTGGAVRAATALICSALWFLCWLASEATDDGGDGPPMLHLLDVSPTMFVPRAWQAESLRALDRFVRGESSGSARRGSVAVFQRLAAAQVMYRTGQRIAWLPASSVYVWCSDASEGGVPQDQPLRYRPQGKELLVTRSYLWRQRGGEVLRALLSKLLSQSFGNTEAGGNLRFRWLEHLQPFAEHFKRDPVRDFLSFSEMAQFRAAVMFLPDFMQVMFHDLYSLCVPILVPSDQWLGRLLLYISLRYDNALNDHDGAQLDHETARRARARFPGPPWLEHSDVDRGGGGWSATLADRIRIRWLLRYANHEAYPALVRFGSLPELLARAMDSDLHMASLQMSVFHRRLALRVRAAYRHALDALVPAAGPVDATKHMELDGEDATDGLALLDVVDRAEEARLLRACHETNSQLGLPAVEKQVLGSDGEIFVAKDDGISA